VLNLSVADSEQVILDDSEQVTLDDNAYVENITATILINEAREAPYSRCLTKSNEHLPTAMFEKLRYSGFATIIQRIETTLFRQLFLSFANQS